MRKLENLKPERVFYYFEELSKIPRESGNEKAVSDYLVKIAKNLGLSVYQDKILNVIIKKPAAAGYENSKGIILQGHIDMVCEKSSNSTHNFKTDAIDLIIENDFLRANNTTLGADNGIAIAMSLAILEDNTLKHPQIEFLATVEEETTMKGAIHLEDNVLAGKYMINIDSEEEGLLTAGSAGGKSIVVNFNGEKIEIEKDLYDFFRIEIKNLFGGHSGMEINKERLNAIKILAEFLTELQTIFSMNLVSLQGGSKDNAIPREAYAEIAIKKDITLDFQNKLMELVDTFNKKYTAYEKDFTLEIFEIGANNNKVFDNILFSKIIAFLNECPTGVNTWLEAYPNIVESSNNLAIVKTFENKITIDISLRSSEAAILKNLLEKIQTVADKYGAKYEISKGYPEWKFRKNSHLRDTAIKTYKDTFNEDMDVTVIHAGLECGAISQHYPDLDMISIGPNIYDVHTPKERMNIKSVEKYYKYLLELIKNLK